MQFQRSCDHFVMKNGQMARSKDLNEPEKLKISVYKVRGLLERATAENLERSDRVILKFLRLGKLHGVNKSLDRSQILM